MVSYLNSRGVTYFLHSKIITLKGGQKHQIFYFAKVPTEYVLSELPPDYEMVEGKTGLVFLRKTKALTGYPR